tara:strand:- start:676 stop:1377 length:702 start_codon:yes stop_codon:yes gene_type:complete
MNFKKKKLVKPRDASSLIIIKENSKGTFVLMGRRPASSKFMPNVYVFPGGAVEKQDSIISKLYKKKIKLSNKIVKSKNSLQTKAIMTAAIRETAEETGLFLVSKVKENITNTSFQRNIWKEFSRKKELPNLEKLLFFGRAITPSFLKIRFHARFFIADYYDFTGKIRSCNELEDVGWINLKDKKDIKIADVTEFLLDQLILLDGKIKNVKQMSSFPMFTWRYHKRWIKWEELE